MAKQHDVPATDPEPTAMGPPVEEQAEAISSLSLPPATGGVLRNLLSTPEMTGGSAPGRSDKNGSLLLKTLQGGNATGAEAHHVSSPQKKHSHENGILRGGSKYNREV